MTAHDLTKQQVIESFSTNETSGLSSLQIAELQAKYGENKLTEKKKKTNLQRFIEQFKDVMILILIAAAVISFVLQKMDFLYFLKNSFIVSPFVL